MKERFCKFCKKDISKYHPAQKYCDNIICQKKAHCERVKRYFNNKKNKVKKMLALYEI